MHAYNALAHICRPATAALVVVDDGDGATGTGSIRTWSELVVRQVRATESIDMIAFASISLAPSNLDKDLKAPGRRPYW